MPRYTATVNGDYELASVRWQPSFGVMFRYVSDRTASFNNIVGSPLAAPQYRMPAYSQTDIRGGVSIGSVNLQLYIHNLFDQREQESAYTLYGSPYITISQPRTLGLTATAHF